MSAVGYSTICWSYICFKLTGSVFRRLAAYTLGDFLVENKAYSSWTIKSDDFSGRQIRRFLYDRRQILLGRFYWQTKLANFVVRLTSALANQLRLVFVECGKIAS